MLGEPKFPSDSWVSDSLSFCLKHTSCVLVLLLRLFFFFMCFVFVVLQSVCRPSCIRNKVNAAYLLPHKAPCLNPQIRSYQHCLRHPCGQSPFIIGTRSLMQSLEEGCQTPRLRSTWSMCSPRTASLVILVLPSITLP